MVPFRVRGWIRVVAGATLLAGCAGRGSLPSRPSPAHLAPGSPLADRTLADADAWARHYLMTAAADSALHVLSGARGDRLLAQLQRAVVLHEAGRWAESNTEFERAERELDRRYTRSLRRAAGSLLWNDRVLAWLPGRAEAGMIPVYRMLNYLALGDRDGAAVEARKAGRLRVAGEIAAARCGEGAVSPYLSALVYDAAGERGDALVSLRHAARALEACGTADTTSRAPVLARDLLRAAQRAGVLEVADEVRQRFGNPEPPDSASGELVIVLQHGWVPHREVEEVYLPIWDQDTAGIDASDSDQLARAATQLTARLLSSPSAHYRGGGAEYGDGTDLLKFAWPTIRASDIGPAVTLSIDGTTTGPAAMEDLSAGVVRDLEHERAKIAARMVARVLAKHLLAEQVEEKAEEKGGELLGDILRTIARITGYASERADTRSWSLLPERVWMARAALPPGEHRVTIKIRDAHGTRSLDLGTVRIRTGETTFENRRLWNVGDWIDVPRTGAVTSR